jgi:hypothetical protein
LLRQAFRAASARFRVRPWPVAAGDGRRKEAEQQEGDAAEDQDVHELDAFEAVTHEHRSQ